MPIQSNRFISAATAVLPVLALSLASLLAVAGCSSSPGPFDPMIGAGPRRIPPPGTGTYGSPSSPYYSSGTHGSASTPVPAGLPSVPATPMPPAAHGGVNVAANQWPTYGASHPQGMQPFVPSGTPMGWPVQSTPGYAVGPQPGYGIAPYSSGTTPFALTSPFGTVPTATAPSGVWSSGVGPSTPWLSQPRGIPLGPPTPISGAPLNSTPVPHAAPAGATSPNVAQSSPGWRPVRTADQSSLTGRSDVIQASATEPVSEASKTGQSDTAAPGWRITTIDSPGVNSRTSTPGSFHPQGPLQEITRVGRSP